MSRKAVVADGYSSSIKEAAVLLNVSEAHIQKLLKGKKLSHTGKGKDIRLNRDEVMAYRFNPAVHPKRSSKKPADHDVDIGLYDLFIDSFGNPPPKP